MAFLWSPGNLGVGSKVENDKNHQTVPTAPATSTAAKQKMRQHFHAALRGGQSA
jgi:hypothetical protein